MEDETSGFEHTMIGASLEVEQLDKDLCVPEGTPRTLGLFLKRDFRFRSKTLYLPMIARGAFGGQVC